MSNQTILMLLVCILFVCFSCVFSTDKENFVDIDQNVKAPVIYNLSNSLSEDTIMFWHAQTFYFNFRSSKQPITGVIVYVNDDTLNFNGYKGEFYLQPELITGSSFTNLTMEVFTESGTGSLADIFHQEGFVFKKTWVLAINKVNEYNPAILSSITPEGFLKLTWMTYPWNHFYCYNIHAIYPSSPNIPMPGYYFLNMEKTWFVDSSYVGGPVDYYFSYMLSAISNHYFYSDAVKLNVNVPLPEIYFHHSPDSLTIFWNKSLINCTYELNDSRYQFDYIYFKSDDDTSFTMLNPGYGPDITFNLYLKSKNNVVEYLRTTASVSNNWSLGQKRITNFNVLGYLPKLNYVYKIYGNRLSIYDKNNLQIPIFEQTFSDYCRAIDYIEDSNQIAVLTQKLSIFEIGTTNPLFEFPMEFLNYSSFVRVVGDSIILFNNENELMVYNFKSSQLINSIYFANYYYSMICDIALSHNLKWFVYASENGLSILENTDSLNYTSMFVSSERYRGSLFDPFDETKLWIGKKDKLLLFDLHSMAVIQEFDEVKGSLMNIDPFTNQLLIQSKEEKMIYVFNLNTRQISYSAPYSNSWENNFYLIQNILYENNGYEYDLSKQIR